MKTILSIFLFLIFSCQQNPTPQSVDNQPTKEVQPIQQNPGNFYPWIKEFDTEDALINQIHLPKNYNRVLTESGTFQNWLQFSPLYPSVRKVKLFDGGLKNNQNAHDRIVDLDVGKRDLQQCADAVMRMRSEYLFSQKRYDKIHFNYTNGTKVSFDDWRNGRQPKVKGNKVIFTEGNQKDDSYLNFKKYLIQIFTYAGTASLEKEMKSIKMNEMRIGDVLIQGGHPGHAVLVMDMAEYQRKKIYLLAQSYMPAQEFHILKNPQNLDLSPWYELDAENEIQTPEWKFTANDLRRFVE